MVHSVVSSSREATTREKNGAATPALRPSARMEVNRNGRRASEACAANLPLGCFQLRLRLSACASLSPARRQPAILAPVPVSDYTAMSGVPYAAKRRERCTCRARVYVLRAPKPEIRE